MVLEWEGKIRVLQETIDNLQIEAAERYKDWVKEKAKLTNRQVGLEAGLTQAFEKQNQITREWKNKEKYQNDTMTELRRALDVATSRYRRAEQPRDGELRVEAKLTKPRRSGEGGSQSPKDRGKRDEDRSGKKSSSDRRRDPNERESSRETTGSREGGEKRTDPPKEKEDRGGMKRPQGGTRGREAEDQRGSKDSGPGPMQLTQQPESPGMERRGKEWDGPRVGSSTDVVDLSSPSLTSEAALKGSAAKDGEQDEVNYEPSSGEEVSDEEGEVTAASPQGVTTPEIVLTKEEAAKKRKNAKAKIVRDRKKAEELAAKNQGVEGEVDAEALAAALRNIPPRSEEQRAAQEALNRAEEVRCREQFARDAESREGAKRKRSPADEENREVISEEKERSSGEA